MEPHAVTQQEMSEFNAALAGSEAGIASSPGGDGRPPPSKKKIIEAPTPTVQTRASRLAAGAQIFEVPTLDPASHR